MPLKTRDPERDAQELLEAVWLRERDEIRLPVDPFAIALHLGIDVYTSAIDQDVSGMLVKAGPFEDPEIYLNQTDNRNRQRFTCAHELGHYVKRSATGDPNETWQYVDRRDTLASMGTNPDEIYANKFAASLLMPADAVKRLMAEYGTNVAVLAAEFGVSADAMSFRLKNLGVM